MGYGLMAWRSYLEAQDICSNQINPGSMLTD